MTAKIQSYWLYWHEININLIGYSNNQGEMALRHTADILFPKYVANSK